MDLHYITTMNDTFTDKKAFYEQKQYHWTMITVFTFCSTQAASTATFDETVSSIEGLLKRNLLSL